MRFDAVVLGGGTAGCVVASRLNEQPTCSVCLLEAGPVYGSYSAGRWPPELLDARSLPFTLVWENEDDERAKARARVLGGGSAMNACYLMTGPPEDYDWGHEWTWDALEPHGERARTTLRARARGAHEFAPWHRILFQAARAGDLEAKPAALNGVGLSR